MILLIRTIIFFSIIYYISATFCYTDCFSKKGCFFKPYGCTPYINCSYAFSYQSDGEWAFIELLGKGQSERNSFVAAGFSKDQEMGDDSVIECSSFNNGPLLGRASYNQGKTNIRMNITPSTENSFVRTLAVDYFNGMIYCRLARRIQVPRDINRNQAFQLDDQHHILVSSGPTTVDPNGNGLLQVHNLNRNSNDFPYVSVQTITVNQYRIPLGSVIPTDSYQPYSQSQGGFIPNQQQPGYQTSSTTFSTTQFSLIIPPGSSGMGPNPSAQQPNLQYNGPPQNFQGPGNPPNNNQGYPPNDFQNQDFNNNGVTNGPPFQGSSVNPQGQGYFYTTPPSNQFQYDQSQGPNGGGFQSTPGFQGQPNTGYPQQGSTPNPGFYGGVVGPQNSPYPQSSSQQGYDGSQPGVTQNPNNFYQGPQGTVTGQPNYQQNQNNNFGQGGSTAGFTQGPPPQSTTPNSYIGPIAGGIAGGAIGGAGAGNNNPNQQQQGFTQNPNNFGGPQQQFTGPPNNQPNQQNPNFNNNQQPNFQGQQNPQNNQQQQLPPQNGQQGNQQQQQPPFGQNPPGTVPQRDSFSSQGYIPGSDNPIAPTLLKVHGILMTLAWMIFISTAILFARFYRGFWPNTTLCGLFLWFHFHRTLNIIGVGATIAGFVCIFVARNWTWVGPRPGNVPGSNSSWPSVHAMLGILACVVAWAQPINAVLRCHPKSRFRFIYNIYHIFFGYGAWLMAGAALMIACTHYDFMFLNRDAAFGLCITFLATSGGVFIFLELLSLYQWFKNRRATGDIEVVEPDGRTHVTLSTATKRLNICRMLILFFYLIVVIGCAVAISVMIGLRKDDEIRQTEAFTLGRLRSNN
uniref:Cytochrome b561 domain-containing protein n=1 Tax=Panagrolaimus sp. PS1159 TaxID=55785 RepID=A0AC35FSW9_9BILA